MNTITHYIDENGNIKRKPVRFAQPRKRKAMKKVRSKPRPGRLRGAKLTQLRRECYERDGGRCVDCRKPVPFDGDLFTRMHMAHVRGKRMFGDSLPNVVSKCYECHIVKEHCGGKVVPSKRDQ